MLGSQVRSDQVELVCDVGVWFTQVLLELTRQMEQEKPVLSFRVSQLGAEGRKRSFDLSITTYLRQVALDYCDVPGYT